MLWRLFNRRVNAAEALFNGHYLDVKVFYVVEFDRVPCVIFIGELDVSAAFAHVSEKLSREIVHVYQHSYFGHAEQKMFFNNTVFVLTNNRMIELAANYCQVLHTDRQYGWANSLITELNAFRDEPVAEALPRVTTVIGFARQESLN